MNANVTSTQIGGKSLDALLKELELTPSDGGGYTSQEIADQSRASLATVHRRIGKLVREGKWEQVGVKYVYRMNGSPYPAPTYLPVHDDRED
jgi:DNA-binding Lrp family transcriptional regulator